LAVSVPSKECNSGQCILADENVTKVVGAPTFDYSFQFLSNFITTCILPEIIPIYLDILDMNTAEFLSADISHSSIVRCASPGFCFRNIPLCCKIIFL
jgi:hypothetical protein